MTLMLMLVRLASRWKLLPVSWGCLDTDAPLCSSICRLLLRRHVQPTKNCFFLFHTWCFWHQFIVGVCFYVFFRHYESFLKYKIFLYFIFQYRFKFFIFFFFFVSICCMTLQALLFLVPANITTSIDWWKPEFRSVRRRKERMAVRIELEMYISWPFSLFTVLLASPHFTVSYCNAYIKPLI